MAEKRKKKGKGKEADFIPGSDQPSKLEYEVAKYLRNNLPEKRTTLLGHKVDYFIGKKAIDALLDSKYATGKSAVFTDRDSVLHFLSKMLSHKIFHRAQKVIVTVDDSKKKRKRSDEIESSAAEETRKDKSSEGKKEKEKKGKKKVKLDMHLQQVMVDANEPYVWIYEPVPLKQWFIGLGLVVGAVLLCLFPLWPRIVRTYVYYLSIAAAGFLFFIIGLAVIRFVVFCLVWGATWGRHHFWILPNLTEDVGFWASFWPLYMYEYRGVDSDKKNKSKKDRKSSSSEEKEPLVAKDDQEEEEEEDSSEASEENSAKTSNSNSSGGGGQVNGDNGFEILDSQEDAGEEESSTRHHPKSE